MSVRKGPKVRLVGGPFGGKVLAHPAPGRNEIVVQGPKKMSRKARWEWQSEQYEKHMLSYGQPMRYPHVQALYRVCPHPDSFYPGNLILAKHPDGSTFYEYVEDSKKEYP